MPTIVILEILTIKSPSPATIFSLEEESLLIIASNSKPYQP